MNSAPAAIRPVQSCLVADGYGIKISVERGHLVVRDGIGRQRRTRAVPRIDRTLRRLLILGSTGAVSLEALRWCHDRGIALVQLDADSNLISLIARPGLDDARLRRAQALAAASPVGMRIARDLLAAKVRGQASVARARLGADAIAARIDQVANELLAVDSLRDCGALEAYAANLYFGAWVTSVAARFIDRDHDRVPNHWHTFDARKSPLGRSRTPSRAGDPVNAMLNYLYALGEVEARAALHRLGLDPGLGIVHVDVKARDSLALDLLEAIRPQIDEYLLELLQKRIYRAREFHETRDGQCRLDATLSHELAHSLRRWAELIAPHAERLAHTLIADHDGQTKPAASTPLTRTNSRDVGRQGDSTSRRRPRAAAPAPAKIRRVCQTCGTDLYGSARKLCPACWSVTRRDLMRQLGAARRKSQPPKPTVEDLSGGITTQDYLTRLLPALAHVSLADIERATGMSSGSCSRIRRGLQIPNPRHWPALEELIR